MVYIFYPVVNLGALHYIYKVLILEVTSPRMDITNNQKASAIWIQEEI